MGKDGEVHGLRSDTHGCMGLLCRSQCRYAALVPRNKLNPRRRAIITTAAGRGGNCR